MRKLRPEDYTQFPKSKPWGYHPEKVEEVIAEYEKTIQELNNQILEKNQLNVNLSTKIEQLESELREMHLQMTHMELPDASEAVQHFVLDDFKKYNSKDYNDEYNFKKVEDIQINDNQTFDFFDNENADLNNNNNTTSKDDDDEELFVIVT